MEHKAFLAEAGVDPRRALAEKLVEDIPLHVNILTYNMSFEKRRYRLTCPAVSRLTCKTHAPTRQHQRFDDSFPKGHYVTPVMQGSYSIKYVLPALVPEMELAYKKLEGIQNGGDAMNQLLHLHVKSLEEQNVIREQLLKYCKLDTLAMVRVLGKLKEITYT